MQDLAAIDLKTLVDNLTIAIFVVDKGGEVLLANQIAKKIHYVDRRESKFTRFGDIIGCPSVNETDAGCGFAKCCHLCQVKAMIDRAFSTKKSIAPFETTIGAHSNGACNLTMTVTHIRVDEQLKSKQEMCIVTLEDRTEFKKKERLEAACETIGAICHEMNQPLQAIMGNVELLTKFQLEDGAILKIEKIFNEMERIKSINTKLMNLAHYQSKPYLSTNILDLESSTEQLSPDRKIRWVTIAAQIAKIISSFFLRAAPTSSRNQILQPPGLP